MLRVSIYNSTISELQRFAMQPLLLPILRAINSHVLILDIIQNVGYSQIWSHIYVHALHIHVHIILLQLAIPCSRWVGTICIALIHYTIHAELEIVTKIIICPENLSEHSKFCSAIDLTLNSL